MNVRILYFALLKDQRGLSEETLDTTEPTVASLYDALQSAHGFTLERASMKAAMNDAFVDWDCQIQANATIAFIPPVAGG